MPRPRVERLRNLREQKGWSIRDLYQVPGCEVSRYLMPRPRTLVQLADIFNVTVEEFVDETEEPSNQKASSTLP